MLTYILIFWKCLHPTINRRMCWGSLNCFSVFKLLENKWKKNRILQQTLRLQSYSELHRVARHRLEPLHNCYCEEIYTEPTIKFVSCHKNFVRKFYLVLCFSIFSPSGMATTRSLFGILSTKQIIFSYSPVSKISTRFLHRCLQCSDSNSLTFRHDFLTSIPRGRFSNFYFSQLA